MHFGVLRQKVSNAFEYVFIENKITKELLLKQRTIRLTVQIHVDIYHLLSNVKNIHSRRNASLHGLKCNIFCTQE